MKVPDLAKVPVTGTGNTDYWVEIPSEISCEHFGPTNFFSLLNKVVWRGTRLPTEPSHASGFQCSTPDPRTQPNDRDCTHWGPRYLIGLCQLGELLLGFGIILIRVWVVFLGKLREEMVN